MITVDGEPVPQNPADSNDVEEALRTVRLELKLCKALAALDPPHELSTILHARITEQLRTLRRYDANDQDVMRQKGACAHLICDRLLPTSADPWVAELSSLVKAAALRPDARPVCGLFSRSRRSAGQRGISLAQQPRTPAS